MAQTNAAKNTQIVKALKAGLKYLKSGANEKECNYDWLTGLRRSEFICNAMQSAACGGEIPWNAYHYAVSVIEDRLGKDDTAVPHTFETWLIKQMGWQRNKSIDRVRLQAHRRAWVNMLIEEFSNKA